MRQGLNVPAVPEERKEELRKRFPDFYGLNNPIDLTPQVRDDDYATVIDLLREEYDGFLIIALTGVQGVTENLARAIGNSGKQSDKPITVHMANNGATSRRLTTLLEKARVPVYPSPERAVRGLKALLG
jgi:acyl-CoA synthetase (NDP forming)